MPAFQSKGSLTAKFAHTADKTEEGTGFNQNRIKSTMQSIKGTQLVLSHSELNYSVILHQKFNLTDNLILRQEKREDRTEKNKNCSPVSSFLPTPFSSADP